MSIVNTLKDKVTNYFGISYKETAVVGSDSQIENYSRTNLDPDIDAALAAQGYSLYTSKMMSDDQVKSCIIIKKLGVSIGGYTIEAARSQSDEDYKIANEIALFIKYTLDDMTGSVTNLLANIAHAIVPGFSVQEINFKLIEFGQYKNKIGLSSIKLKPSHTFTFKMDAYGNVEHLIQTVDGRENKISKDKVLLFTYDPQATGLPFGTSDLRAAYKHYWSKDALMRFRNVAAEKYSAPTAVGKYPPFFSKKQIAKLLQACQSFSIKNAIVIPQGAEIELIEPKGSVVLPYDQSIDGCNRGIARAIFGQILATDEGSNVGSYALGKIHRGILGMYLTGLRNDIAEEVFYEQLFKRLVEYNYGKEYLDYTPRIVLAPPDEQEIDKLADIIEKYIDKGVVHPDEPFIRALSGFPPKPENLKNLDSTNTSAKSDDGNINAKSEVE